MNQIVDKFSVQNIVHFKQKYKEVVQEIVQCRVEAGFTQEYIAEWIGVDRRKIIDFEAQKKVDIETLLNYAGIFSIEINLSYKKI
jgi:DNA-binding XRE family transcriptional regulator